MATNSSPKYTNPPLVEVVFGVTFSTIIEMQSAHYGVIWEEFKSEFPHTQDAAPYNAAIEQFEGDEPSAQTYRCDY